MPILNTTYHPENRETTVLLQPKDLHRPSVAGLVAFVAIYFNCSGLSSSLQWTSFIFTGCNVRPQSFNTALTFSSADLLAASRNRHRRACLHLNCSYEQTDSALVAHLYFWASLLFKAIGNTLLQGVAKNPVKRGTTKTRRHKVFSGLI